MTSPDYSSELLVAPRVLDTGVEHLCDGTAILLPWSQIEAAHAAEVGEPQGVRTIVFDLVRRSEGTCLALRMDAEPGEDAQCMAQRLADALGERARPCLKTLASDGISVRWYPDLRSFEEDSRESLG